MIPQKLALTNFMPYREAKLDFAGIHIACLAGENGAGKSALLDAMTWAVWGHSRLGARQDDDLIHLGEDEMTVEFTFRLGGDAYRVTRQRSSRKRGRSVLEFQVCDGDRWRSLSEGGIRATQEKIERILRLDYDTFVNSAYLRQGQADEFTVKTAAERKRVLGDILGLDRWAEYEDRVKQRLRNVETEREVVERRLEEIERELARESEYEADLEAAAAAVDELSEAVQAAQEAYQAMETARAEHRHVKAQIDQVQLRLERLAEEQESLAAERAERETRIAELEGLLSTADEIEAGYAAYQEAIERERALGAKLEQSRELNERAQALRSAIDKARHAVEAQRDVTLQRIADLEARLPDDELMAAHDDAQAQLTHLEQLAQSRDAAREDLAAIAEEQAALQARNEALRMEMNDVKEKIALLEQAGAECPLCEQSLTEDHRLQLLEELQNEGRAMGDTYRANQAQNEALRERTDALREQIAESDELLRDMPMMQRKVAALAERVEQGEQAAEELEVVRQELAEIEDRLAQEAYAEQERQELAQVLKEAETLGYDAAAHATAREAVGDGQIFAEKRAQLEVAQSSLEEQEAALDRLSQKAQRLENEAEAERARRAELEDEAEALRLRLEGADEIEAHLQEMRGQEAAARQRLGAAKQRLEACKALRGQRDDKREQKEKLAEQEGVLDELRTAFSVRGVPAMIIEAAVPEIEDEANRLLAKMTGGRMHVRFDTQRETKAGAVRETLEIKIADEIGTRPYENYSGGEQFRVNFAIRIALSKLLARRAGAQLQTLVIDEGFGTQDAQGRQRLVEAINAIQDEFARVLVITHIEELKDAFPARIEVTKTAQGAIVEVV